MTRRSDMMLEDIFGCDHAPEIPVTEDGQIVHWLCRCGRKVACVDPDRMHGAGDQFGGSDYGGEDGHR